MMAAARAQKGEGFTLYLTVKNVGPGAAYDPTPSGMPVVTALQGNP